MMKLLHQAGNVYVLDTNMFNLPHFSSAFLVKGEKLALVDTGLPDQYDALKKAITFHGFSVEDIDYIFITHCEHPAHAGSAGHILRDNGKASLHLNRLGAPYLLEPSRYSKGRTGKLRSGKPESPEQILPVPEERMVFVEDDDVVDLGDEIRIRVLYTPGHQPSGMVLYEEKFRNLFINDLVGNYFADCDDYLTTLIPAEGSDVERGMASLRMLQEKIHPKRLCLGHFGISENPEKVFALALADMQALLEIGEECMKAGRPEDIEPRVLARKLREGEKILCGRGRLLYEFLQEELNMQQAVAFSEYYQRMYNRGTAKNVA